MTEAGIDGSTNSAEKKTLVKKIDDFREEHEDGLMIASASVSVVMLITYAVIGFKVLGNLYEYDQTIFDTAAVVFLLMIIFAIIGCVYCYNRILPTIPSPVMISAFIFGGTLACIVVFQILRYVGCFLFGVADTNTSFFADLITKLIIR